MKIGRGAHQLRHGRKWHRDVLGLDPANEGEQEGLPRRILVMRRDFTFTKVAVMQAGYKWPLFFVCAPAKELDTDSLYRPLRIRLLCVVKARTICPSNFPRFGLLTLLTSESGLLSVPERS